MEYRAVGLRCAVHLGDLDLPIPSQEARRILEGKGFRVLRVDMMELARGCVGSSQYRRGADPREAPQAMDCSSFMKWLYAQRGIWLPRYSIQQRELGERVQLDGLVAGDLVFTAGRIDWYHTDPTDGVGHVGIATGVGTVIHAASKKVGIVESALDGFVKKKWFRGARRLIPRDREVLTFQSPGHRIVETSDEFRWLVLQSLPR